MKALYALIIILLVSQYKAASGTCSETIKPSKASDCTELDPGDGKVKCCYINKKYYFNEEYREENRCAPVSQQYYERIGNEQKSRKDYLKANGAVIESFEYYCSSNHLYISFILLLILLLL